MRPSAGVQDKRGRDVKDRRGKRKKERKRCGVQTYSECAQLARTTLLPDGQDLRQLTCHTQCACPRLEVTQRPHIQHAVHEQGRRARRQRRYEDCGQSRLSGVVQNQHCDDHILHQDTRGLAVRGEGEAVAEVVGERDEVARRLEQVGQEAHAGGAFRADEVEDLRDLDNAGCRDNSDSQGLGDGEFQALGIRNVDIEDEAGVALLANEGEAEITDGWG